jgi:hypothetical protein
MRIKIYAVSAIAAFNACAQTAAQSAPHKLTIQTYDGGSAVTELGYGIAVNKGSSLHRRWYVINDASCPVELGTVGIRPVYSERGRNYDFNPVGDLTPRVAISAVEVIFVQFDLWGNRERGLSADEINGSVAESVGGSGRNLGGFAPQTPQDLSLFSSRVDGLVLAAVRRFRRIEKLDRRIGQRRDATRAPKLSHLGTALPKIAR